MQLQQAERQARTQHAADTEHAVKAAHDRPPAKGFELGPFGVDGDVAQAHGRAEHEHRRQECRQARILEHEAKRQSHRQPNRAAVLRAPDPRDDRAREEERRHRADRDREQHERKRDVAQRVLRTDGRDVRPPGARRDAEHEELKPGGATGARYGQGLQRPDVRTLKMTHCRVIFADLPQRTRRRPLGRSYPAATADFVVDELFGRCRSRRF
jgi:hypothetical protein